MHSLGSNPSAGTKSTRGETVAAPGSGPGVPCGHGDSTSPACTCVTIYTMPYANKDEQREYMRNWKAARRSEFFADKKSVDCGSTKNLELDHKDPTTKVDRKIWTWSEARRLAEIAKCQVLCRKCHRKKTNKTVYPDPPHGTTTRHDSSRWKCKCQPCKDAHAEAKRVQRRTGKYPKITLIIT